MFERFTNQSRRVVVLAQEEARMLDHNYIGTEHLLLGLLHEGRGSAARALKAMDVTLQAARDQVGDPSQSALGAEIPQRRNGGRIVQAANGHLHMRRIEVAERQRRAARGAEIATGHR